MSTERQPERAGHSVLPPILQVVGDGAAGGGTTVVLQLSQALGALGAHVTVASRAGSYILAQAERAGLATLPLDFASRGNTWALSRRLSRYLQAHPGTLVHAHGARAALPVAILPGPRRAALIYTVHGFHYAHKPFGVRHLAMLAERFCMQRATRTVFVGANDAETAAAHHLVPRSSRTQLIYNGAAHSEPSAAPAAFDLAFLGRLHFQKNPTILIEILKAARPLRPTLRIIGGGQLEPEVRAMAGREGMEGQVSFCGEQTHADALRILDAARVMVLPSRWEGLPLSVIEAMHRGIPVVASDILGTREIVVDGETGFLVPANQARAYADAIARLLRDDVLYAAMRRNAVARARALFSIQSQLEAYISLYASVAPA